MTELLIRNAEQADYLPIIQVVNDWWGGRRMSDMLPKLFFVHFKPTCFVAEHDGKILGFVIGLVSQTFPDEAYIHFVGVDPSVRKSGLAKSLYRKFFETAINLGCRTVHCVTSPVNKVSIAFHRSLGFSIKDNENVLEGIAFFEDYDGKGEDRVLFYRALGNMENL
jgi:ribosomal protein S18 acetylase RimI-like enzyme